MLSNDQDLQPLWMPDSWVAKRQIYENKPAAWFAYRLDVPEDETSFVGEFKSLNAAKEACETRAQARA
jgi:hypothetical protein